MQLLTISLRAGSTNLTRLISYVILNTTQLTLLALNGRMKYGEEKQCIRGFGRETQMQQTTVKKGALMGG